MHSKAHLEEALRTIEAGDRPLEEDLAVTVRDLIVQRLVELEATADEIQHQRKQVTVLFADVSGFTQLSDKLDPEVVSDAINDMWQRLDGAVLEFGGMIDKHLGDGVMALFGAPVAHENDPEQAIRAALSMQDQLGKFVASLEPESSAYEALKDLKVRIGINTGLALLGPIGVTNEYTAIGDTVNVASRLESAAPVGGILISHATYSHVRGIFDVDMLEPISVKGKPEPLRVYAINGVKPRAFRLPTRGVAGIETPMIGRDEEMETLQTVVTNLPDQAQVITINAEAGTGKSRLLYEFMSWLDTLPQSYTILRGRSTEDMETLPYSLLRDIFSFHYQISNSDTAAEARRKLQEGFAEVLGEADAEQQTPYIGQLLGFDYSDHPAVGVASDARQLHDRAFNYLTGYFSALMDDNPVVVMLEDVHWSDDGTLDLLEHLMEELSDRQLILVAATRSYLFERRPEWEKVGTSHTHIVLEPLSDEHTEQLIREILRNIKNVPADLQNLIIQQAEGNPFYVEEVIKMLMDDGVIIVGDNGWQVDESQLGTIRVPQTMTGLVQARLDRLTPTEQRTLQRASAVGRIFWSETVQNLREVGETNTLVLVDDALPDLKNRELVYELESSTFSDTQEYMFNHTILRDVTYETVLMRIRPVYHEQVARWLVEHASERANEFAGRIGQHYELAGLRTEALEWYRRAAQQADKTYALSSAADYYRRAMRLTEDAAERRELAFKLGEMLQLLGEWDDATQLYHQEIEAAEADNELAVQAHFETALGEVRRKQGEYAEAGSLLATAYSHFESLDHREGLGEVLHIQGNLNAQQGDLETAQGMYQRSLEIRRELDDKPKIAALLSNLAIVAEYQGDYELSLALNSEGLDIRREIDDRWGISVSLSNMGNVLIKSGEYEEARERLEEAVHIQQEIGERYAVGQTMHNLANAVRELGDYERARQIYRDSLQTAVDLNDRWTIAFLLEDISYLNVLTDQPEAAMLLYGAADYLREEIQSPLPPADQENLEKRLEPVQETLGADAANAKFEEGRTLLLEDVVPLVLDQLG